MNLGGFVVEVEICNVVDVIVVRDRYDSVLLPLLVGLVIEGSVLQLDRSVLAQLLPRLTMMRHLLPDHHLLLQLL